MSNTRGGSLPSDPNQRAGKLPSAREIETDRRLIRNVIGVGSTRVSRRCGKLYIDGGSASPTEWGVTIDNANHLATVSHRPIVFAARILPAAWGTDESFDYSAAAFYGWTARLTVDLLSSGVGKGSGFIFAEINLAADTVTVDHTTTRPVDDPTQSIVRWPLVHITETTTTVGGVTTYRWRIDTVLHTGQIKLPALFAP